MCCCSELSLPVTGQVVMEHEMTGQLVMEQEEKTRAPSPSPKFHSIQFSLEEVMNAYHVSVCVSNHANMHIQYNILSCIVMVRT